MPFWLAPRVDFGGALRSTSVGMPLRPAALFRTTLCAANAVSCFLLATLAAAIRGAAEVYMQGSIVRLQLV